MAGPASQLLTRVAAGEVRAIARAISILENGGPEAATLRPALFQGSRPVSVIGVTGSPGAGKSTLVDQLAAAEAEAGKRVAVLAVDPSSPFSGGAVLGDRIRMNRAVEHPQVFIRSMATRGALGGVARATVDAIAVCALAGFDTVVLETVGVGQAEVDVARIAETCLVVLVPGMGDSVQAIKAGILEIADCFVINKADRDGADQLQKELRTLLSLATIEAGGWEPKVVRTVATTGEGTAGLQAAIREHQTWLRAQPAGQQRQREMAQSAIVAVLCEEVAGEVIELFGADLQALAERCAARTESISGAVATLRGKMMDSRG